MADYKGIQGFAIQNLTSDPTADEGQVWYNSTTNIFKETAATTAGAWASANAMNTGRANLGGAGTQTAGLAFGGVSTLAITGATEEYDGTNWATSPGSMGTVRGYFGAAGTQTAALAFGGTPPVTNATEAYNGSTWTAGGAMGTTRYILGGCGLQTAALAFGGFLPPASSPRNSTSTEEYDGSTWTANPTGFKYGKTLCNRSRYSNCSFSFWWYTRQQHSFSINRRI
jgi:hypothetical protein